MRAVALLARRRVLRGPVSLALVLACTAGTLAVGAAIKAPCASGNWSDGRQYRFLCYSDVVPLLGTEQLTGGRLPYLDRCKTVAGTCDEYPVLTMYFMRLAAWVSDTYAGFFVANAVLLALCGLVVAAALFIGGAQRAMWFALAPTLLVSGFINWDLFAVALATGAILAFFNRRDTLAGALLGLGAAAKLYPALFLLPLIAHRLRERSPDRAVSLGWSAAGAWVAVNLPFALAAPGPWSTFFRFNAKRPADWDSLWYIGCRRYEAWREGASCLPTAAINAGSALLFVALVALVWLLRARRRPDFPRWTLGLPILVLFLLTNKVFSPQYSLWLLPWFALALPGLRRFVVFEVADLAVFVTRFWFFGHMGNWFGVDQWVFETAVVVRAVILVWCLADWVRSDAPPLAFESAGSGSPSVTTFEPTAGAGLA